jgi:hypothetical protein
MPPSSAKRTKAEAARASFSRRRPRSIDCNCSKTSFRADMYPNSISEYAVSVGSPTIFVGGDDMYFGNDRLDLVRDAVLRRQAAGQGGTT